MMTPQERLKNDPVFSALVQQFIYTYSHFHNTGAGITPSEIREASGLAWQIYMDRAGFDLPKIELPGYTVEKL